MDKAPRNSLISWIAATRPWSFTASALTVMVTLAYLEWRVGGVDWVNGGWAVVAIVFFHAGGNTWSDWHDFRKGVDAADTYGVDTLTSGRFSPNSILNLSLALYGVAILLGVGLMLRTGLPLLWIGLAGFVCALLYPPLKYRAWGDVVIMLNYCLLPALGTSYVAIGQLALSALWVALPVGVLVDAILHANNTRDMRTDRRAHTRTLAHMLGVGGSRVLYISEALLPFVWVVVAAGLGLLPLWCGVVVVLLPMALSNCRAMLAYTSEAEAAAISSLDIHSAKLQLLFSLALVLSLLLPAWLLP